MARAFSRTLTLARFSPSSIHKTTSAVSQYSPTPVAVSERRYRSTRTTTAQLIEVDLDSSSSTSDGTGSEVEVLGLKLEDVIHGIMVRRYAPDWLPFRPGSSYWVPPNPRAANILQLVGKLTNRSTEEDTPSFSSVRGWPETHSFFIDGSASPDPGPEPVKVQVQVLNGSDFVPSSKQEDED